MRLSSVFISLLAVVSAIASPVPETETAVEKQAVSSSTFNPLLARRSQLMPIASRVQ